jgi:enoyl-CoA hydratase/carnithine racemase
MGGGTEISLACRYRVASSDPSTRIGLPEVKLGIYPAGAAACACRAWWGAPAAFDVMLTGRTLSAKRGEAMGLVDKVVEPAVLTDAATRTRAPRHDASVQAARARLAHQYLARAPGDRTDAGESRSHARRARTLPRALRDDRNLAAQQAAASSRCLRPNASRW